MRYTSKFPLRLSRLCFGLLVASVLSGCARNGYYSSYQESAYQLPRINRPTTTHVKNNAPIRLVETEEEYCSILEEGYLPLGQSHLVGRHMPWFKILQVSVAKGGDLVVVNEIYRPIHRDESVIPMSNLRRRMTYPKGTVFPDPINQVRDVPRNLSKKYSQTAVVLKKVNPADMYGIILGLPPLDSEENKRRHAGDVWVLAVMKGSQAERDGIQRGDKVTEINGMPLVTANDVNIYLNWPQGIREIKRSTQTIVAKQEVKQ